METTIPPTPHEHYFTVILEDMRSDFRAVIEEVVSIKKELRSFAARTEARFDKLETRFDSLETRFDNLEVRFDEQHRQVDGIMEMVARNSEDIFQIKEGSQEHSPGKHRLI